MKLSRQLFSKLSLAFVVFSLPQAGYAVKVSDKEWKQYIPVTGKTIQADIIELKQDGLKKSGTMDILFEQLKDGSVKIVTKMDSPLNNLVISADKVETSLGNLTDIKHINNIKTCLAVTGPWKGILWKKDSVNEQTMSGEHVQFGIGKRVENQGQGILYFDAKVLKGSLIPSTQFSHVLYFPLHK